MLNPATIMLIVQAIQAAVAAAPQVVAIAEKAKDFVASLFAAGLITKATQDSIHAHVDATVEAFSNGRIPAEFTVEPDPTS